MCSAGDSTGKWSPSGVTGSQDPAAVILMQDASGKSGREKRKNLLDVRFIRVETSVREG